jgi:NADPH-dependent 2,4-dienoyl-CoA reductase/sulfur reductase-like enzyme
MHKEHFIIIGNGPAGNQAALTLREKLPETRVTLISKSREGFYLPHLLPNYIAGKIPEKAVYPTPLASYKELGIKLRRGQEVVGINLDRHEVTLGHKEVLTFDGLIIAVGGRPRIPEPLLVFQDLLFTLKTLENAKAWKERLSKLDRVLIMGGDLTSLALTEALLHLKKKIYFMLNEEAFWPLRCDEGLLEEVGQRLAARGVEVLAHRVLRSVTKLSDGDCRVELDGQRLEIGLIGAFFGLVPDVRFLARTGLQIDRGVLVDEYLNAGVEGIYAAGDCAQVYHPNIRDYWVSIGHDNAVALGRIAAENLVGGKTRAEVSMQGILTVQGIRVNTSWWMDF